MYKENLPKNCPPINAEPVDMVLYRIFVGDSVSESEFQPYSSMIGRERYKESCDGNGISFFKTYYQAVEKNKQVANRNGSPIGYYIAAIRVTPDLGVAKIANTGHVNLWLFKDFDEKTLTIEYIKKIK